MKRWLLLAVFVLIIGLPVTAYNSGVAPSIMGHTVDEIDGLEELILSLIPDPEGGSGGGITCPATPIYDSMNLPGQPQGIVGRYYSHIYGHGSQVIPIGCFTPIGCVIKQEIYNSKGLYKTRQYEFNQESNGKWRSSYRTGGGYVNGGGDTTKTTIIPTLGYQYLFDDYKYSTKTIELDRGMFTFIDISKSYGMKVYVCTFGAEGEDVDPDADPEP